MVGDWYVPRPLHCPAVRQHLMNGGGVWIEQCAAPPGHTGDHTPTPTMATSGGWAQTTAGTIVYPTTIGSGTPA